ncbi:MAG: hypothetical protein R3Y35_00385 [Clostridia bacterium]
MDKNEMNEAIKNIFSKFYDVLASYDETNCYRKSPEDGVTIRQFLNGKFKDVSKAIFKISLVNGEISDILYRIFEELKEFVNSYEAPGTAFRWIELNPKLLFFDAVFDIIEEDPTLYEKIKSGETVVECSFFPSTLMINAREKYFKDAVLDIKENDLEHLESKIFQNELLETLKIVFINDFNLI